VRKGFYSLFIKRIFDISVSLVCIIIFIPFWVIIIPMICISNKGPVFFIQKRPGKNGRIISVVKFKTMNDEKSSDGELLPDAERITAAGKIVRSLSLDELPQIFNILKGDMSLVGPRPLLIKYLPLYTPEQNRRHEVRPGITGWAQVNGRNAISWEKKFEYDVWYVDHVSFFLDMKILFMTIKKVIFREGINAGEEVTMEAFRGNKGAEAERYGGVVNSE
jgi:undecaprenyl phosphate N,N'-diacetylbacillosamine 1-phosphate transferase